MLKEETKEDRPQKNKPSWLELKYINAILSKKLH